VSSEFINFYLKDKQEELKKKWKIVYFLEDELVNNNEKNINYNNEIKNYYSISKLKKILKNKKYVTKD